MSLRYYDVLEALYRSLEEWRGSSQITKDDVLDSVRDRVLLLMTHVITTPLIGTAYSYPGDLDNELDTWLASSFTPAHAAASTGGPSSSSLSSL